MARCNEGRPRHVVDRADARTARRLVSALAGDLPAHDADDIAQEVLCALAFHSGPLPACQIGAEARSTFLRKETSRQLAEHERLQARAEIGDRLAVDVLSPPLTSSAEELSLASNGPLRHALAALQRTEPALYAVLDLALDGAPMSIAAAALGTPEGTACTRLRRARAWIRAFLDKHARTGGRK